MQPQGISKAFRDARGRDGTHQIVTLTKNGDNTWNSTVIPALEEALLRASASGTAYPYFDFLSAEQCAGLERDAYDGGVRSAMQELDRIAVTPTAIGMSKLSEAFACERFTNYATEESVNGVVTAGILERQIQENIQEIYKGRAIPENAIDSYRAGIAVGAVKLIERERHIN
ncbi:MAG: hypothetical protein CO093_05375 [Alphaproteobacteria bacterium CG_4_9_14_3_um_filter_47_13]|nr:MAG: hypothetical protein CO093_05375 [Alphaproteobacteria bacterium CG_4_9_14_3_um_filter_47_13]